MKKIISIALLTSLLGACAHHDDVVPDASGTHYIALKTASKDEATREAFKQASHFCEEKSKKMFVVNQQQSYKGETDEQSYIESKHNLNIVSGISTAMWVFGDGHVDDAGALVAIGSAIGEASLGKPYLTNVTFKCS
ncbi:hypothetical protein [Pseudoalteromonas denitrificans]|jgi:hypothetical protein|uniref:Lipoprotein n=1 Tax=Pseudoalteromonas denitrificans DSM 6059 TaxID=1123010 RepID=A0A1I1Q6X4_9GAMM|nr:hypothetical protein [Pseudoalteromonas denitrificans]SFD14973.1 hypothetical protein SAMN02745724_03670 [Pseudoalteromonas denitrificans DSM 6059]